jgi:maleate cis-trans isomerase
MDDQAKRLLPRFRFGAINPRSGGSLHRGPGYQFYRLVPTDVMEISTVLGLEDYTVEKVEKAIANFWPCVDRLAREKVEVIVLGGAPISSQLGRPRVLRQAQEKTGIRGDAPLEAVIAAMKSLGLTKLAIGSRWAQEINDAMSRYLQAGGIEVVAVTKRNQWGADSAAMSLEEGLQTALDVGREAARLAPEAQAVFVPGGAAMSLHVIPAIEEEFGKPTFTNLSAEVWNNLVRPGVIEPVNGWGCLLAGARAESMTHGGRL